ncbi:HlyD family efflux transporter periplasmic adaptor subunit [Neisseria weaveri]|uniref:Multidrug resistance translocase n=1 Tax=Neisseria weaveri TaxID=28091 RepID=A0A448VLT3_9NEIS|nr:HlyD family efflux transporter periplasmic adaptor subunit [Neisseria weaveri]EGV37613.1 hypothetical protein l11_11100 [Neisseria weaveri LMG 5135]EGV37846.1 hypothetical protein l13_02750 [Neisseria weaveri ATCC 51223]SAY51556.1 multidrug resistance translocase [Neisseria weaveri]VEJ50717.1 multidrug resistance translocase [Neisseria weaveri]
MDSNSGKNSSQFDYKQSRKSVSSSKRSFAVTVLLAIAIGLGIVLYYFLMEKNKASTHKAYVAGPSAYVIPQASGVVKKIVANDGSKVKKNDLLLVLDDTEFQTAYEDAQNVLIKEIQANKGKTASLSKLRANVLAHKADLARAQANLRRRESLLGTEAISNEELSHARAAVVQAQASLRIAEAEEQAKKTGFSGGLGIRNQPEIQAAVNNLKKAWLNLQYTQIRAPIDGQVSVYGIQAGQRISAGEPVMKLFAQQGLWVNAFLNPKQLSQVRMGQAAEITADLYGSEIVYTGKVVGFSSNHHLKQKKLPEMSLISVRIALQQKELQAYPLKSGLSMNVTINTAIKDGSAKMLVEVPNQSYVQELPGIDWAQADRLIDDIFEKYARNSK